MKLLEVVCMFFGHRWKYKNIFHRQCKCCQALEVAEWQVKGNTITWRTL